MAHRPSHGAMLITAPSEHELVYEMAVRITRAEASSKFDRRPWVTIRADVSTGEVYLSAGVKVKRRLPEEDGA